MAYKPPQVTTFQMLSKKEHETKLQGIGSSPAELATYCVTGLVTHLWASASSETKCGPLTDL